MTYNAAIIGCGKIAGGYDKLAPSSDSENAWTATHAGAYALNPDTQLIGIVDLDTNRLQTFQHKWKVPHAYPNMEELFKRHQIDIVSICSPTEFHGAHLQVALEAKVKGVILEKPLSYSLQEARVMRDKWGRENVQVNYFRRWNSTLCKLRERIHSQEFGQIYSVGIRYTKGIFVNASHYVDLVLWLFGKPTQVQGLKIWNGGEDPGVDFRLSYVTGTEITFMHIPTTSYVFVDMDIVAERARIILSQRGQQIAIHKVCAEPHYGLFNIVAPNDSKETEWKKCMLNAVEDIILGIKNNTAPRCSIADAYDCLEICNLALN